ncbi:MAG: DUF3471 domain-containing protein [Bacteroidetes bacterium]|nr:DUF3471 domain-containing protein [Bacteroidota bacterium]
MKKIIFSVTAVLMFSFAHAQLSNSKWKGKLLGDNPRNVFLDFKKDKLDVIAIYDSSLVESMSLIVEENTFSVKKIEGQSDCDNMSVGKYAFSLQKDVLMIKKLSDDCGDRSSAIDGTKWKRWKDPRIVKVDESILKKYVGVYELDAQHQLSVTLEKDQLFVESATNNIPKTPIYPESATKFYVKIAAVEMDFVKDNNGKVIKLISHEEKDYSLKKIK